MKIKLLKDEMSTIIESISEQFDMINQHENNIPQIEMDIFMRNIQKLYENTLFLNKANQQEQPISKSEKPIQHIQEGKNETFESKEEEPADAKVEIENQLEEKVKDETILHKRNIVIAEQVKEEIIVEETKEESVKVEITENKQLEEDLIRSEKEEENQENKESKSSQFNDSVLDFGDILEENETETDLFSSVKANSEIVDLNKKLAEARNTQSIVEKLQSKRIESLKTVIGVNDKFYFINELFAGNSQKYEDIIYTLNNFKKLEDAMVYFSTLKYKFGWDEESEAYEKLVLMLERKFEMANA